MKKQLSFFDTIRIALFDFKSYVKFIDVPFLKVILNRIFFVLLISIAHIGFINKDIKFIDELNQNKQNIFEDINYLNGVLDIKNSPTLFTLNNDFILIGDTREQFDINNYSNYKMALVLLKDSFILKNRLNTFEIKYSDILMFNELSKNNSLNKESIFFIIESLSHLIKYLVYIIFPIIMIFNFFFIAFAASVLAMLFALICSSVIKFRVKFSQVYKMMLFAQTAPFLIISVFEIIAKINGVGFVFPTHILEIFTLFIFLISIISVEKNNINKKIK